MAKGKGIENIISEQTQTGQIGFLQKIKKKLSNKVVTYGLAFSLLFPLARRALADTIYQKTHELEFLSSCAIYGKKQNPTTKLEVKVDCDKVAEKEYELKLSFFAEDWDISKNHIEDFVLINNILSNFYLVYPNEVAVGEPKESAYIISRKHGNKKIGGEWKDLAPFELSPRTQLKLGLLKVGIKVASASLGFLLAGPVGAGVGLAASFVDEARTLGGEIKEAKRKAMLVNTYGGTVSKIPFYPVDKDTPARTFTIPIEVGDSKEEKEIELNLLLDVGLRRGLTQSEEYGQLRDLLIKVPLGESVNYKVGNKEPEKPEKGVEEEQSTEDAAEKPKQQPQQTEQAVKKEGSLEVKVDSEPARGNLDKNILGNLEKKVIVDDDTSFFILISVPQGKDELNVTFSRKEGSEIRAVANLYYPSGEKACERTLYPQYPEYSEETLNVKSPHVGAYILEIKSNKIQQIDISSNCPIEEPKYQINSSVKGGEIMFYAIDVNEINSAEPLLCRLDWENSGHPVSIELYDPASPSSKNNSPKGLSDISICKTSPSAGKWILAVKGSFAEGGLEKFILQSYHHKIQGLRCEKHEEFIYDETTFSYNQQKDGNLLVGFSYQERDDGNMRLFYPNGKEAWLGNMYGNIHCPYEGALYFPFVPAGEYKFKVAPMNKLQRLCVYFVSSQNAYPIENTEINKNESKKNETNKN